MKKLKIKEVRVFGEKIHRPTIYIVKNSSQVVGYFADKDEAELFVKSKKEYNLKFEAIENISLNDQFE